VTVFTSNYLDGPTGIVSDESLTDRIGARFRSRLHEMCKLIFIEAPDFREVIRIRRGVNHVALRHPETMKRVNADRCDKVKTDERRRQVVFSMSLPKLVEESDPSRT
jgi:hypothetical protein